VVRIRGDADDAPALAAEHDHRADRHGGAVRPTSLNEPDWRNFQLPMSPPPRRSPTTSAPPRPRGGHACRLPARGDGDDGPEPRADPGHAGVAAASFQMLGMPKN
jgi:hypothetical protein